VLANKGELPSLSNFTLPTAYGADLDFGQNVTKFVYDMINTSLLPFPSPIRRAKAVPKKKKKSGLGKVPGPSPTIPAPLFSASKCRQRELFHPFTFTFPSKLKLTPPTLEKDPSARGRLE
jgi:hypothetical protein